MVVRPLPVVVVLLSCAVGGCLSSQAPTPKAWMVEPSVSGDDTAPLVEGGAPAFGTTRVGVVSVDAPYDKPQFVVRRTDGSVAVDHYNVFAAAPASLLRVPVRNRLISDSRFSCVVQQASIASADSQVEAQVTDLSLDCRTAGQRVARAAVTLNVVKTGRGPRVAAFEGMGSGEADATDGNYTRAFSEAVDAAVSSALKTLKSVDGPSESKASSAK